MDNVPQWPAASHACNHVLSLADGDGNQRVALMDNKTEEYFKSFPPGYRFSPTDIELIVHYLNKKINNEKLPPNEMHEVNLYRYSPEHISGIYPAVLGKLEWYFFTSRDRKYANGTRPNRAAGTGYWKATGADKKIRDHKRCTIGYKKTLVFYEGKPPKGEKTSWIMNEYRTDAQPRQKSCASDMRLDDYVLCRIYKKDKSYKKQKNLLSTQPIVESQNVKENHSQAKNDSHEALDDVDNHVDEVYRDYPQPISLEEVQGNSQSRGDNIFLSFDDYGLEQKGLANSIGNKWPDMNSKDYQFVQTDFVNPIEDQWNINTNFMSQSQLLRSLPVPTSTPTSVPVLPMTNVPYLNYLDYLRWEEQEIQKHDFMNQINFSEQVENLDEVIGTSLISFDCPSPPPKRKKRF